MLTKRELIHDLTHLAGMGKLDPAFGREEDILAIAEVFSRHNPKSAILVGSSGVGKSQIVKGLAVAGVRGETAGLLEDFQVVELDSSLVHSYVEGSGERLSGIMDFLRKEEKAILAIDNIDKFLLRLKSEEKGAERIAPLALAVLRRTIACIGTTSQVGYDQILQAFPDFEQRFEKIEIAAMRPLATLRVLERLRQGMEHHHNLRISNEALREAIICSEQYFPEANFPGKAIELLDRACSSARVKTLTGKIDKVVPGGVAALAKVEVELKNDDVRREAERRSSKQTPLFQLPVKWDSLRQTLPPRLPFQRSAIFTSIQVLEVNNVSLDRLRLPKGVLLFTGREGMGQLLLVKAMAEALFGSEKALFAMHLGVENGEAWTEQLAGLLQEEMGRSGTLRPKGVLLFQHAERGGASDFETIESLIRCGACTGASGRIVNGAATIIVLCVSSDERPGRADESSSNLQVLSDLSPLMGQALLDRVDAVVPFKHIVPESYRDIIHGRVRMLRREFRADEIGVAVQPSAYEYVIQRATSKRSGPERLLDATERFIVQPIRQITGIKKFPPKTVLYALVERDRIIIRAQEPEKTRAT
jgi:ATP-dependent Clp protease ATP-binding subunit ClpC